MTDMEQEKKLGEILKNVPPEKAGELIKFIMGMVTTNLMDRVVPESFNRIREVLGHSDVVLGVVNDLAEKTADSREDVLLKALSLYEVAIEAKQRNERLVLVGHDYQFIREIIGLEQRNRDSRQYADVVR